MTPRELGSSLLAELLLLGEQPATARVLAIAALVNRGHSAAALHLLEDLVGDGPTALDRVEACEDWEFRTLFDAVDDSTPDLRADDLAWVRVGQVCGLLADAVEEALLAGERAHADRILGVLRQTYCRIQVQSVLGTGGGVE